MLGKYYQMEKMVFGEKPGSSKNHVDSRDHMLHMLSERVMKEGTPEAYEELQKEIDHRRFVDGLFAEHFSHIPENNGNVQNYDCLRLMVGEVEELCGIWSDYSLKYVRKLADACDSQSEEQVGDLIGHIGTYCTAW